MIGDKINPTGRKQLAEARQSHSDEVVREPATKQVELSADVLDVNVGDDPIRNQLPTDRPACER